MTEQVKIMQGVRKGCVLPPTLFNIYSEDIFGEVLTNIEVEIRIIGKYMNYLRYADDTGLLARNLGYLQLILYREKYGLDLEASIKLFSRIMLYPGMLMAINEEIKRVE